MIRKSFVILLVISFILPQITIIGKSNTTVVSSLISPDSSGFKRLIIYYGWLNTSNILQLNPDIVVVPGTKRVLPGGGDYNIIEQLRLKGVKIFVYIHNNTSPVGLGSSFRVKVVENTTGTIESRYNYWLSYIESIIDNYTTGSYTGVFLDECDPSYFTSDINSQEVKYFTWGIGNITSYAHENGLKTMINGVMGYANLSDWYLWEVFYSFYDPQQKQYRVIEDFLREDNYSSPLQWVNGYSRYLYLKENGLLNRTLAVSNVNLSDPRNILYARISHALARIMNLSGWGYADAYYYSGGGSIPRLPIYEYGPLIEPPFIDGNSDYAEALFLGAYVSVNTSSNEIRESFSYNIEKYVIDGNPEEYTWPHISSPINGDRSSINDLGISWTQKYLYVYVKASYENQPANVIMHVYIDSDSNSSTGYAVATPNGSIGADYLVEIYSNGEAKIYNYTGSSGSDWSWSYWAPCKTYYSGYNATTGIVVLEVSAPSPPFTPGTSRLMVSTTVSYSDDAKAGYYVVNRRSIETPSYLDEYTGLSDYVGLIVSFSMSGNIVKLDVKGPEGLLVNYTFYMPYTSISEVKVNGTPLSFMENRTSLEEGYYWDPITTGSLTGSLLTVNINYANKPSSKANLKIEGNPSPIPEPWIIPILTTGIALFFLLHKHQILCYKQKL